MPEEAPAVHVPPPHVETVLRWIREAVHEHGVVGGVAAVEAAREDHPEATAERRHLDLCAMVLTDIELDIGRTTPIKIGVVT